MATTELHMVSLRDSDLLLADAQDDVRGMTVRDPHGHRLGEVDDLVIDQQERRARLLVVSSGGILGMGTSKRLVPIEAVSRVDDVVHVDRSHMHVHQDDAYDPDLADAPAYAKVYGRYNLTPSWTAGRVPPYFHHRD